MLKMLHMAHGRAQFSKESPIGKELVKLGDLEVLENCREMELKEVISKIRGIDVLITMWEH
jgi:hypothetical protein